MKRILRGLGSVLLAAAILTSCDPGPAGLFYLLEEEKPLNTGTEILNNNTATFVLRFGGDYYTAIGATLLHRPASGGSWESVSVPDAPKNSSGATYAISSGATDGTNLYISYAPYAAADKSIFVTSDGTTWSSYGSGLPADEPVQALLYAGGRLFAATQSSSGNSSSDYTTYYSIYYDQGSGSFASAGATDTTCGCPSSIAFDGTNYWITAGSVIFTGTSPAGLAAYGGFSTSYISADKPVFGVCYDADNGIVIASGTEYLFDLTNIARSTTFGSTDRHLSSVVVVPSNEGGSAVVAGVKPWGSDDYTGYYEYDADANASFGSVEPDTDYTKISTDSNYVTTLDDSGIEGFYYDSTGEVLFARTAGDGLWSNTWNGSSWSGWNRE